MTRTFAAIACFFTASDCISRITGVSAAPLLSLPHWAEALGAAGWVGIAILILVKGTG